MRLCKGAYREPATVAFPDKKDVDASYDRCSAILARAPIPLLATHDDARIAAALKAFDAAGPVKSDYELQMLYGIRGKRCARAAFVGPYGAHLRSIWNRIGSLTFTGAYASARRICCSW